MDKGARREKIVQMATIMMLVAVILYLIITFVRK